MKKVVLKIVMGLGIVGGLLSLSAPMALAGSPLEASMVSIMAVDHSMLQERDGKTAEGAEERFGQGVIVDPSGIIVTNQHVIGDAPARVYVALSNGQEYEATVLHRSKPDFAFIKIEARMPLKAITWGDPAQLEIGNTVHAYGQGPSNNDEKKSGAIVQIYHEAETNKMELMSMNIPLKDGDSGGPVVDQQGSLVGIIMANQISDPSKSYAITVNTIKQEYLKSRGSVLVSSL